jgi:PPOX class probable F420-dependent enzyme
MNEQALRILEPASYSKLTTFKKDGSRASVPIWHAVSGGKIWMFTEAASWKVKRIRRDPRIEITTCDWRGNEDGKPTWTGTARIATSDADADARTAYAAIDRKYGWQKSLIDLLSKIGGRYDKRAILEITLDG